jgi:hypothetical protein
MHTNYKTALSLLLSLALGSLLLLSQAAGRGTVTGRVLNSDGSAAPRVKLMVKSDAAPAFSKEAVANDAGDFSATEIPIGQVMVEVLTSNNVVRATGTTTLSENGSTANLVIRIPAGR